MSRPFLILVIAFLLAPFFSQAQQAFMAMIQPMELHTVTSEAVSPSSTLGERVVTIDLTLFIESEVVVEIRDALGRKLFESEATYPEGDRQIKVGVGDMIQGLYFVRVSTDLDEKSEIVIVERPK